MSQPLVSWRKSVVAWSAAMLAGSLPIALLYWVKTEKDSLQTVGWLMLFYVLAPLLSMWLMRTVIWSEMEASANRAYLLGRIVGVLNPQFVETGVARRWWWLRVRAFSLYGADLTIDRAKPHLALDSFFRVSVLVVGLPVSIASGWGAQVWLADVLQGTSMARLGPVVALLLMLGLMLGLLVWRRVQPTRAIRKQWAGRRSSQAIWAYRRFVAGAAIYLFLLALVSTAAADTAIYLIGFGVITVWLMGLAHSMVHRLWPRPKGESKGLWIVLLDGEVAGAAAKGWRNYLTEAQLGYRHDLPGRVTLIHRVARGWWGPGRGPVTVVAPPSMRLTGEHLTTAWQQGRLKALFPKVMVGLQDWLRTLPPADRWDSLPLRELYPATDLMLRAVQSLAQAGDTVLLLSQDEAPLLEWRKALALQHVWLGWQGAGFEKTSGLAGLPFEWLVGMDVANHKVLKAYADSLLLKLYSNDMPQAPAVSHSPELQAAHTPEAPIASEEPAQTPSQTQSQTQRAPTPQPPWPESVTREATTSVTSEQATSPSLWQFEQQHVLQAHNGRILSLQCNLSETMMVSTSRDRTMKLWPFPSEPDPDSGSLLWAAVFEYKGHEAPVVYATFSPDGRYLLSASDDHKVMLWSTQDGRLLSTFGQHQAEVSSVAFSPDGRYAMTGSRDGTACLLRCDDDALELLSVLEHGRAPVGRVLFSPRGDTLLTAAGNGSLRLWNLEGRAMQVRESHESPLSRVVFSPNGQYIASGAEDGLVALWQSDSDAFLTWQNDSSGIIALEFSQDGRRLLSANRQGHIELHHVEGAPDGLIQEGDVHSRSRGLRHALFAPDGEAVLALTGERLTLWQRDDQVSYAMTASRPVVDTPTAVLWHGATLAYGTTRGHLVSIAMDNQVALRAS